MTSLRNSTRIRLFTNIEGGLGVEETDQAFPLEEQCDIWFEMVSNPRIADREECGPPKIVSEI